MMGGNQRKESQSKCNASECGRVRDGMSSTSSTWGLKSQKQFQIVMQVRFWMQNGQSILNFGRWEDI